MIFARFHFWTATATLLSIVHGWSADLIPTRAKDNPTAPLRKIPSVGGNTRDDRSSQAQTNRSALRVSGLSQTIHGGIQIPALIAVADANRFSFLPPPGWRAQSDVAEKRMRLAHPPTGALITIDIVEGQADDASLISSESFKEKLLARYPNGQVMDEFQASALGRSGPALDLEWRTENHLRQVTRVALIPFSGGRLEFSLTGAADVVRARQHDFNRLLLSFRAAPLNGKLEIQSVTPE